MFANDTIDPYEQSNHWWLALCYACIHPGFCIFIQLSLASGGSSFYPGATEISFRLDCTFAFISSVCFSTMMPLMEREWCNAVCMMRDICSARLYDRARRITQYCIMTGCTKGKKNQIKSSRSDLHHPSPGAA